MRGVVCWRAWAIVALAGAALVAGGCGGGGGAAEAPQIAASNSYLESAVRDLLGAEARVLRLAEPGSCPGHFDLRPGDVAALRACRLVLRFDFQAALDARLGSDGPAVCAVSVAGGLGEPASYRAACEQVAAALVAAGMLEDSVARERLAAVDARLEEAARWAAAALADGGLRGRRVVSSAHQAALCRALGLEVVSTFGAAELAAPRGMETVIKAGEGAVLVIANKPEGRSLADVLADRLGAPVVVLDNFPDVAHHGLSFDGLFRDNVAKLLAARP